MKNAPVLVLMCFLGTGCSKRDVDLSRRDLRDMDLAVVRLGHGAVVVSPIHARTQELKI
jgi:hypothetical protein